MKPPDFEYARPATVADAVSLLASAGGDAKVLAGGQSLVPLLNFRLAAPSLLVDVNRVDGLAHLTVDGSTLRIGATTRMRVLELDPLVRDLVPVLAAAARWVGHVQIRNRGTVGGSVAHADPAAEVPAVCLLLDAELVATGPSGERRIPARDFFAGFLTTTLAEDELLTEIRIPAQTARRWGFREYAQRRGDFALAGAATTVGIDAAGRIDEARIVVFGTSDRPIRARSAEAALAGAEPSADGLDAAATAAADEAAADDPRPDAAYRRVLTRTMVRRALEDAFGGSSDGHGEVR
ncbi:MAG TPA: xanthine dehydrogenase family protein subunit M [Candidatus Limnocylindrales bacterium]|nr:xanthine dehydrogenase family protein subunit M [Candidatus Limnocylindrales bacterium]